LSNRPDENFTKTISVHDLRVGMFVVELDRPWLGTPFLLEGLLISHPSQIELLTSLCKTVTVDLLHSVGDSYERLLNEARNAQKNKPTFIEVARRIRKGGAGALQRPLQPPQVHPRTQCSALEEEILYSHIFFTELRASLQRLSTPLQKNEPFDVEPIETQLRHLSASVSRNSEAILWLNNLQKMDGYTYAHAMDVAVHLMVFARFLGMPQKDIERLSMAGLLQDIGMIELLPDLMCKTDALTKEEYDLLQSHVKNSLEILSRQKDLDLIVLETVARHHERVDGSGYPRHLKGDTLDIFSELAGLIDTYCAIIRQRPHAPALSTQKAISVLVRMRGNKFRETIIDQFIQCMGIYPIGSLVELNTGEVGVVIQQNQVRRLCPRVLIILDANKLTEPHPRSVDLLMEPLIPTGEEPYCIVAALPEDAYGISSADFYLA